jgi:hypothetical protein
MMRALLLAVLFLLPASAMAQTLQPRVIIAVYDSKEEPLANETDIHGLMELPANHLGYFFRYHDIRSGELPKLGPDVAGVLVWFNPGVLVPYADRWLNWLEQDVLGQQKRLLLFGSLGIGRDMRNTPAGMAKINKVMHAIGVHDENRWIDIVYGAKVMHSDPEMIGFERKITGQLMPYLHTTPASGQSKSYLTVSNPTEHPGQSHLVVVGPQGGYVADNYAVYRLRKERSKTLLLQQWLIHPFGFLKQAMGNAGQPVPDITTVFGRRIAFTQMDGDGWNNYSALLEHRGDKVLAAQAALEKFLRPHPDIPFSVGMIGSDLATDCYGLSDSERFARKIAEQPNVQVASHTYSHIQYWNYFAHGDPKREKALLRYYPARPSANVSFIARLKSLINPDPWEDVAQPEDTPASREENAFLKENFGHLPRSYACDVFDLNKEISGNAEYLNELSPKDKPVRLLHWSGDTSPFAAARKAVHDAGLLAIGGGVTQFITDYPSISTFAPYGYIGSQGDMQIYAANGNENTLHGAGEDRFTGMRYLPQFALKTEIPRRLLPLNLYFHVADAGNPLALQAVNDNIAHIRQNPYIRLYAAEYAQLAQQFYQARIERAGDSVWNIASIDRPISIRIPQSSGKTVDFNRSKGVWGMRYLHGALYVQLADKQPYTVALANKAGLELYPAGPVPYVIESAWPIKSLRNSKGVLIIGAQGYGLGTMRWRMPTTGSFLIRMQPPKDSGVEATEQIVQTGKDGILQFTLVEANGLPITIHIQQKD